MIWKPVLGFEGLYEVSEHGDVRKLVWNKNDKLRAGSLLVPSLARGYKMVVLFANGKRAFRKIHRLVCEAFHGPGGDRQAAHADCNKLNNHYSNLRWATPQENTDDNFKNGLSFVGAKNPRCLLSEEDVLRIREASLFGAVGHDLAKVYGVHPSTIYSIVKRKIWSHVA